MKVLEGFSIHCAQQHLNFKLRSLLPMGCRVGRAFMVMTHRSNRSIPPTNRSITDLNLLVSVHHSTLPISSSFVQRIGGGSIPPANGLMHHYQKSSSISIGFYFSPFSVTTSLYLSESIVNWNRCDTEAPGHAATEVTIELAKAHGLKDKYM